MKTFGINALAELLEKDRATIVRGLRGVPADSKENGHRRWRMSTAVAAMERHKRANSGGGNDGGQDPALMALFAKFDKAYDAMKALETVEGRRKASIALRPLIAETNVLIRERGVANGQDAELVQLRADKIFFLCLRGFEAPCEWTLDEAHKFLSF
ncbi:MAG TPA: hypothetical protein VK804_05065 [Bradyrhizobium sp.]|jgi:hypothetical protein|uniref:hypothetical protein n=1 Tax=Bradyrhizobium sp. TaxID=376 RepID=UPI002C40412D|nr:hypothetical protein [Bradyrhizobium sp.]HTA99829.1 hypothetical protein [Bradyrhizobium sp.]